MKSHYGDEFITRSWLDWLATHHPRREVWLDCMEPGRAAHLFRDTHPRLRTTNTLWQTAHTVMGADILDGATRIEKLVTDLGSPKTDFGLRDLRTMGSLHLLGGGYLNTLWPANLGIVAAMTAVRRAYGVHIFATGQGLLPHDDASKEWMAEQLAQFDFVEARDEPSAEAFGVHAGTDDAFLAFANSRPIYSDGSLPGRMVLVQGDDMFGEDERPHLDHLINDFVEQAGSSRKSGFVEAIPPEDMRLAATQLARGAESFPFMRIWEEGLPARDGQEWLTSRFHFHLLAAAAGASGVVVNARPGYYDVKHELLIKLGTGWNFAASLDEALHAEPTGSQDFPQTARLLGAEKAQLARRLYSRSRSLVRDQSPHADS